MLHRFLLFLAVLLAFGASVTHGFHFDDYSVVHNASWRAFQTRPLTTLSFALNARASAYPAVWHAVSLSAHLACALLLYQLLLKFMSPWAALIGAAFFAVHPLQAEAVAYVYSRSTLFSTALSLTCCLLWTKQRRWLAVACFGLALTAKEDCAALPIVLLLFERLKTRDRLAPIGAMALLATIAAASTLFATRALHESGAGLSAGISAGNYLFDQGYVILRYLRLLVIPYGFTIDPEIRVSAAAAIVSWLLVLGLAAFAAWKKNRWLPAGLILLLPSSSIFPLAGLAADHRMYLPMAAFAGLAGVSLTKMRPYLATGCILLLIGVSASRMNVWASDQRLWSEAEQLAPDKLRPRIQLSRALEPTPALQELQRAQVEFPNAIELDAEFGRVYLQMGQPAMALMEFGKVLGRTPGDANALNNRGIALQALGQVEAAQQDFARALKLQPCLAAARENLGLPPCR